MKASVIDSPKHISIIHTPEPEPASDEVLVKLNGTGVCISNLPVWEGRPWFTYPFEPGAPGHEGYGVIVKAGADVNDLKIGDRVALLSYHAYAEFDKVNQHNVVKLPSDFQSSPFPGEPLSCVVNIFRRSLVEPGQTVVVIGSGFIGCLLIQLLKTVGVQIIAVSQRSSSLKFAEVAGADKLIRFGEIRDTAFKIKELATSGISRVVEATGAQRGLDLATEIIDEYGKLIIAGYHQDGLRSVNLQQWNWKGIDVINAHERDPRIYIEGLKEAVKKTNDGVFRPAELISHYFEFNEINKAFQILQQKPEGFLKGVILFS